MSKLSIFLSCVLFSTVSDVESFSHVSNFLQTTSQPSRPLNTWAFRQVKSDPVCLSQRFSSVFHASKSKGAISARNFCSPVRLQQSNSVFERLSTSSMSVNSDPLSWEDIMGDIPNGPDPVQLTQSDMRLLKKRIKGVIERNLGSGDSTHPLLKSSSKDFFERSEKAWRPMVIAYFIFPSFHLSKTDDDFATFLSADDTSTFERHLRTQGARGQRCRKTRCSPRRRDDSVGNRGDYAHLYAHP